MIRQHEVKGEWSPRMVMFLNYIMGWDLECLYTCTDVQVTAEGGLCGFKHYEHNGVVPNSYFGRVSALNTDLDEFVVANDFTNRDLHAFNVILNDRFTDHSGGRHAVCV